MKINSKHPKYIDFIRNEIKTLGFIKDFSKLASFAPGLMNEATMRHAFYTEKLYNKKRSISSECIEFNAELELKIEKIYLRVFIEALVRPEFEECSFVFTMCKYIDGIYEPLRKFHYDYIPVNSNNDRKSLYHLQYGGKSTPSLRCKGIDIESALHSYLSRPRLEAIPMNLAILLDAIFCECTSVEVEKLVEDPQWRDLVKTNEEFLYKEYFSNINSFFAGRHHSRNSLYRDLRHGKI